MKNIFLSTFLLFIIFISCQDVQQLKDFNHNGKIDIYEDTSRSVSERTDDILPRLTLEQKIHLLVGRGMNLPGNQGTEIKQKVAGAAGSTYSIDSLGIPSITLADGPAGLRIEPVRNGDSTKTYYATAFPIATLLASTWDTSLVKSVGSVMGNEVKEYGVDVLLAPALNIHRNPLGGRNFEYYSEDPLLSGNMAAAMVNGIQSNGVGTSIKHFVANNQETNRMLINTMVNKRALREIYLKGFRTAVQKAHPWTVMSAYNKVNGQTASENKDLLTTILRDDWGFNGLVMTDWFAGQHPVAQMKAGNDLLMPGTPDQYDAILQAVKSGKLSEDIVDRNVKKVLSVVFKSPTFKGYDYSNDPDLKKHAEIARKAAAEGIVLLKNENQALPVADSSAHIAAFGNTSYDFISGGTGSGDVNEAYTISLVKGLESAGYNIDENLQESYQTYLSEKKAARPKPKSFFDKLPPVTEMKLPKLQIEAQATEADVAFITIGRRSGEFRDRKKENFYLSETEKQLIKNVSEAFHARHKKVVVILNIGNVVETASWKNQVDGILVAWQGGQEAGNAVADIISGNVNPSGKLPTTFSVDYSDVPSSDHFPGKELSDKSLKGPGGIPIGVPSEVIYKEGIYVGYRYFNTFDVKPSYEFGYGLSYTHYAYHDLKLSDTQFADSLSISVRVENTGDVAGKEVAQLYLSAPQGHLDKPKMELRSFAKTTLLKPGESEVLKFTLKPQSLASFDPQQSAWIAAPGSYAVKVGASSVDIKLKDDFNLENELTVKKTHSALTPPRSIDKLNHPR